MLKCRHCGIKFKPAQKNQLACSNCCENVLDLTGRPMIKTESKAKPRTPLKPFPAEEEYHRQSETEVDRGWTLPTQDDLEEAWFNRNPAEYSS